MKTLKPTKAVKDEVVRHFRKTKGDVASLPEHLKRLPSEVLESCRQYYLDNFTTSHAS